MGQMWDISNAEHENGWRKCEKNIYFWSGAEKFLFCSCVAGTCLLDPPPSPVPYELSPGKLAARSAHIWSQRKAPAAEWHHTQTHGPVKVWEPAFGWKQWRRRSQRRSLLRCAFAAACWHVRCVLSLSMVMPLGSIVISRWSFSRLMSTGSLYGSEELDDIYQYGKYLARVFVQRPFSLCACCGITKPPTCFWS